MKIWQWVVIADQMVMIMLLIVIALMLWEKRKK